VKQVEEFFYTKTAAESRLFRGQARRHVRPSQMQQREKRAALLALAQAL
jgi:hypothetical protein